MSKFKNTYRIDSIRLKDYDYSTAGMYFVTICTHNRTPYFGKITNNELILNECGNYALNCLISINKHFSYVEIENYVIMPNHLHFILFIKDTEDIKKLGKERKTLLVTSLQHSIISPQSGSLSTIVRSYKSAVTNLCNKNNISFKWQSRYFEHIIRNEKSYTKLSNYIQNNIINWELDDLYEK